MYRDLEGKTALVTGAGKKTGIGFAIAEKVASCRANVVIADLGGDAGSGAGRTATRAEMEKIALELSQRHEVKTLAVNLDVTDPQSIRAMISQVEERFGRVDALFNNAGATFGAPSPAHTYDEGAWMKTIEVNLHGVFRVSRACIPMMLAAGNGAIVNIASKAGKTPGLANGAYSVAKAGVVMLTKVMALELGRQGIRVNAVCPGIIMTDMQAYRFEMEAKFLQTTLEEREKFWAREIPQGRVGAPGDVADVAVYLASAESGYITGQALNVCGGLLMAL